MFDRLFRSGALFAVVLAGLLAGCHGQQTASKPAPAPAAAPKKVSSTPVGMRLVAMAYPTGDRATSAVLVEKLIPVEARLGQSFNYKIMVTNLTGQSLHEVTVSDALGGGVKLVDSTPSGNVGKDGTVTWALGTLGPRAKKTVSVNAEAVGPETLTSCASVAYNSLLCATIPVVQPKLLVAMSGPAKVLACEDIQYKIKVTNTGSGSVTDVKISNTLPAGLQTQSGKGSLNIGVGTLTPGQSRSFIAKVNPSKKGKYTNQVTATGSGLKVNSNDVITQVVKPELKITKTGAKVRYLGRTTAYEIKVTNTGDGEARDTVVEDTLPAGASLVSVSQGGTQAGGKVRWTLGTLKPNDSKTVSVTVKSDTEGTIRNSAVAKAFCADAVNATASTEYKGIPAILLEVIDEEDPIEVGDSVTYKITATNQGSAAGTNIKIVCTLEGNVEYVSSSGASAGKSADNAVTFDALATLAPGKKATWKVVVKAVKTGDVRFHVSMNSDQLTRPVLETEATNLYQ